VEQAASSRYMINTSILKGICCFALLIMVENKLRLYFYPFLVLGSVYICIISFANPLSQAKQYSGNFNTEYSLIIQGKPSDFSFGWPLPEKSEPMSILSRSFKAGIFDFDFESYSKKMDSFFSLPMIESDKMPVYNIDSFEQKGDETVSISGWAFLKEANISEFFIVIILTDSTNVITHYFIPHREYRGDVNKNFISEKYDYSPCGFRTSFDISSISPGEYKLKLILADGKTKKEIDINKEVFLKVIQ